MAGIKVKQRDITDCGAACMGSIAAHYKLKLPVSKIRQYAGTDQKGTNVYGLVKASEKLGFTAKGVKGGMDSIPKIPLPAIAHVIVKERLQHFVVIYRVTQKHITVMDPGDGQLHKYTVHDFEKIWTGVLVLLAPNENFREKNEKVSVFSRFLFLLKPHRSILTQTLFGAIIYTLLGLSTSFYIQKITDFVLVDGNKNLLNLLGVFMLIILLLQLFIQVIKSVFILKTGQKIDARLILGYYKHLLKLPQRFFDTMRVGEIISRVNDAVKIRAFINDTAIGVIVNFFIVVFAFLLMFLYNWKLAFIITLVLPLYALVYFITNRLNKKQERKLMEKAADLESQLVESLNSVRTIKSFGLEGFANTKTEVKFIGLLQTIYKSGQNSIFSASSSEFLSRFFTIILLWTGAYFVLNNTLTPGELLSFYALIGYFTGPATSLITMNKTMQNALIAADRLFEIMDLERDENEEEKIHLTKEILGDIRFENVNFTYGTRVDVFENFSLVIPMGKITAIIGESGSGKTTLASLLQKLYPLNGGNISIGNYNLNYLSMDSLREVIGIVPQKIDLFAGNVLENIAIGDFHPDMKKIVDICSKLGILDFIEKLPAGFGTYLGENGATLSGGQKQRIAIARVLYKEPEVLILDEATSNLDSASEEYIQYTIRELKNRGKTILIIAHRLSTVVHADQIVVLEEGKVVEKGVHKDLMEQEGKYFHLWKKQIPDFIYA